MLTKFNDFINENLSTSNISGLKTFNQRKKYVQKELGNKYPYMGSARYVYFMDNKVIKIARNKKGIAQNLTESNPEIQEKYGDLVAKVYDYDKDGKWIVLEKLNFIREEEFKKLTHMDFNHMCHWLNHGNYSFDKYKYEKNPFAVRLKKFLSEFNLDIYDISSIKNWGQINGKPKLLDFGLTIDTARKLYKVYY